MLVVVALVAGFLAFGPQAVLSFSSIAFSSIEQCGSFSIAFAGGKAPEALPLTLTVVPFNSTPLAIDIPNSSWNESTSTGAAVTFLPFLAGTTFVASLDDAAGNPTGNVSDIIRIQPSSNSSCLPATPNVAPAPQYMLDSSLAQCQSFNVSYNASLFSNPPSVRAFEPLGRSFILNETSSCDGMASYVMDAIRGEWIVLLFDDGMNYSETSSLATVDGDSSSSQSCFPPQLDMQPNSAEMKAGSQGLTRNTIIGVAVGAGIAVIGSIILILLYILRDFHKRRRARAGASSPSQEENGELPPVPPVLPPKRNSVPSMRYINDTAPYGIESSISPSSSNFNKKSFQMFAPSAFMPWPRSPVSPAATSTKHPSVIVQPTSRTSAGQQSISSLDIEHILDMATMYSNRASALPPASVPSPAVAPVSLALSPPNRLAAQPASPTPGLDLNLESARTSHVSFTSDASNSALSPRSTMDAPPSPLFTPYLGPQFAPSPMMSSPSSVGMGTATSSRVDYRPLLPPLPAFVPTLKEKGQKLKRGRSA